MKLVIQRVTQAEVVIDGETHGKIGKGYMVLMGVSSEDTKEIVDKYVTKMVNLRIFEDENGKTNLSLKDVGGEILMISQFTLYADCKKGNRPSLNRCGSPDMASELYDYACEKTRELGPHVETGVFGADMKVSLTNDGPFTIVLDEALM